MTAQNPAQASTLAGRRVQPGGPLSGAVKREGATPRPSPRSLYIAAVEPHGFKPPGWGGRDMRDRSFIYIIQNGDLVKVGFSNNVSARLNTLSAGSPRGLRLRCTREVPALFVKQVEAQAHEALASFAVGREWFRTTSTQARLALDPIAKRSWAAFAAYRNALHVVFSDDEQNQYERENIGCLLFSDRLTDDLVETHWL